MVADIRALALQLVEAWNDHDVDRVAALYARFWQGFPDLRVTVRDAVTQGERVALHWTARGTHSGSMLHIPATGREVEVQGMVFLEFCDGHVIRGTSVWDMA